MAPSGIIDVLEDFRRRGSKCGCVHDPRGFVRVALKKTVCLTTSWIVLSCDTIGTSKEPLIFEMALRILAQPRSETGFEDTLFAAETAKAPFFPLVGVYDRIFPNEQLSLGLSPYYVKVLRRIV